MCDSMACAGGGSVLWIVQLAVVWLGSRKHPIRGCRQAASSVCISAHPQPDLSGPSYAQTLFRAGSRLGSLMLRAFVQPLSYPNTSSGSCGAAQPWGAPWAPLSSAPCQVCERCSVHPRQQWRRGRSVCAVREEMGFYSRCVMQLH